MCCSTLRAAASISIRSRRACRRRAGPPSSPRGRTSWVSLPPRPLRSAGSNHDNSGEGRWTIKAAVDTGVPTPVLTASLYERFNSRGNAEFQGKLLSAVRLGFGGHVEKAAEEGR